MENATSDRGEFKLPGGYVKDDKVYYIARVRGLTGNEEDILLARNIPFNQKIDTILSNCLQELRADDGSVVNDREELRKAVQDMTLPDRTYLLVCLRIVTLGDEYAFKVRCPECGTEMAYFVKLSEVETVPMPQRNKRTGYEFVLPSGKKVVWDVLTGRQDAQINQKKVSPQDLPSLYILARVRQIDSETATMDSIKKLTWGDRLALRQEFERVEGYVDLDLSGIVCTNPTCGVQFDSAIDLGQADFFFPGKARRRH